MDAANILKPTLARGELQIIGATTLEEYRKHIEKDAALERRFQPVTVGEPTRGGGCCLFCRGLRDKYEAHHKVKITDEAIEAAVNLSTRYISDRYLPDKAIDLVDEAASRVRLRAFTRTAGSERAGGRGQAAGGGEEMPPSTNRTSSGRPGCGMRKRKPARGSKKKKSSGRTKTPASPAR